MKLIGNRCRGAMLLPVTAVMFGSVMAPAGMFVPRPGSDSFLTGVFCTSARDCWAVGYYTKNVSSTGQVTLNQALHWNGLKWSRISTPNPGGIRSKDYSDLFATRCSSGTDCWAVGSYGKNGVELNQVLTGN